MEKILKRELRISAVIALVVAIGVVAIVFHWRTAGILLICLAAAAAAAYFFAVYRPARIPGGALLDISLSGPMREFSTGALTDRILGRGFPTLHQLRRALEGAANSPIETVMVQMNGVEVGLATAQELNRAFASLGSRGKRVVAALTGDNVTAAEYMIACGASEIVANPDTGFAMLGVAAGSVFAKGALEKLQVRAQTLQWKEYKGAAEPLTRETMSPQLQESLSEIVEQRTSTMSAIVADARKIDVGKARDLLGGGMLSARQALEARLIDRVGYPSEIKSLYEKDHKRSKVVSLGRVLRYAHRTAPQNAERIALVYGIGPVVTGQPALGGEYMHAETTAEEIMRAARNDKVRAIVFRVNSPGGSPVGSDIIWRAVEDARGRGKPVVVSMGDVAGSGGYYVAMGADAIVAEQTTITGSIGIVFMKLSFSDLMAWAGLNFQLVKSSPNADLLSPHRALTESELAQINALMAELYDSFTAKAAQGRKLSREAMEKVARGRVWSGQAALAGGLVDSLGGLERAIAIAREKAGIPANKPHQLLSFTPPAGLAALNLELVPAASASWLHNGIAQVLGLPRMWIPALVQMAVSGVPQLLSTIF